MCKIPFKEFPFKALKIISYSFVNVQTVSVELVFNYSLLIG